MIAVANVCYLLGGPSVGTNHPTKKHSRVSENRISTRLLVLRVTPVHYPRPSSIFVRFHAGVVARVSPAVLQKLLTTTA